MHKCAGFHLKTFSGFHQKVSLELRCTKKEKFANRSKKMSQQFARTEDVFNASNCGFSPFSNCQKKIVSELLKNFAIFEATLFHNYDRVNYSRG